MWLKSPSKVIISPIFNKGMRFVEGGLLFEELNTVSFSPKSVCKLSILRPFVVYFRRVIKFVVLPLWPSPSFLLLKSKRTKFILVATTAKKAMFMIERCLSVGDTGSFRRGGGYSLIFALRLCAAPKGMVFLTVLVWIRVWFSREYSCGEHICRFNFKWIRKSQYANSKWTLRNLFVRVLILVIT